MKKEERAASQQAQSVIHSKGIKFGRKSQTIHGINDTSREAYASIEELRQTERIQGRAFFYAHPDQSFCRADLCDLLQKPINHITRICRELLDEDYIEVSGRGTNPRTGITVEVLRLKQKGKEAHNG